MLWAPPSTGVSRPHFGPTAVGLPAEESAAQVRPDCQWHASRCVHTANSERHDDDRRLVWPARPQRRLSAPSSAVLAHCPARQAMSTPCCAAPPPHPPRSTCSHRRSTVWTRPQRWRRPTRGTPSPTWRRCAPPPPCSPSGAGPRAPRAGARDPQRLGGAARGRTRTDRVERAVRRRCAARVPGPKPGSRARPAGVTPTT